MRALTKTLVDPGSAQENLDRIARFISQDGTLQHWFAGLIKKSQVELRNEIYARSERMRVAGDDEDLIFSFRLPADPGIFEAARRSLQSEK